MTSPAEIKMPLPSSENQENVDVMAGGVEVIVGSCELASDAATAELSASLIKAAARTRTER